MALVAHVRRAIEIHRLATPGETVIVGVSGGPDSVCLLHVLHRIAPDLSLSLHVAHLNHQMRGEDADTDAAYVAKLAANWDLPVTIETANVPAIAHSYKLATEEAARRIRYTFLAQVAGRVNTRTIAVAHNADDQTETVLMHWLRGSGLAGLRGMLPATPLNDLRLGIEDWRLRNGDSGNDNQSPNLEFQPLTLIRPLLDIPRSDIEAYCVEHTLKPRFDRSNLDTTFFRNRLRHELIPYLESYNVNIREILRRSASVFAADHELLREQLRVAWGQVVRAESDDVVTFDLNAWMALPLALKRSTIRQAIHRLRRTLRNINFVHVDNAVQILEARETGTKATLPQGLMLTISYNSFTVAGEDYRTLPDLPLLLEKHPVPVVVPGHTRLPGSAWILKAEVSDKGMVRNQTLSTVPDWEAYLDAEIVGPSAELRPRIPGDHFCPLGMGRRGKRITEFMINEKIPASWRDQIPLLVNEKGQIVWVCGWRPDDRARVTDTTQRVVWLRFEREGTGY